MELSKADVTLAGTKGERGLTDTSDFGRSVIEPQVPVGGISLAF